MLAGRLVQTGLQGKAPPSWEAHWSPMLPLPQSTVTARPCYCKHIKWEWDQVELVLPGHQPKDVTTHRWSQLPFYLLLLHLVSSEQELLPCDSDAFIEWTAIQMAISGIETVTLRCKPCCQWWFQGWGVEMTLIIFGRLYRGGKWIWSFP